MPDRKFGNVTIAEFNNKLMQRGKRSTAERIVYGALTLAENTTRKPGVEVFETAIKNASPLIEVKPRRVGGATYQVPVEIRADRRSSLAMRWIIEASRKRPGKSMSDRLAGELVEPDRATAGGPVALREDDAYRVVHQMRPLDGIVVGQRDEVVLVDECEVELCLLYTFDAAA